MSYLRVQNKFNVLPRYLYDSNYFELLGSMNCNSCIHNYYNRHNLSHYPKKINNN